MKKLNKILISLIIPLAVFAYMDKDCFSFVDQSLYVVEIITNEAKSYNSITSDIDLDLSEVGIILTPEIYTLNLKYLSSGRVIIPDRLFTYNLCFSIWQPPKISWA